MGHDKQRSGSRSASGGHRIARLEQLILEELVSLFEDELEDPGLNGVRPVGVTLSADYRHIRAHCVMPETADRARVSRALERASGLIRRRLLEAIELKRAPELHFALDTAAFAAETVDRPGTE